MGRRRPRIGVGVLPRSLRRTVVCSCASPPLPSVLSSLHFSIRGLPRIERWGVPLLALKVIFIGSSTCLRLATFPARCSPWTAASPTPMSSPFPSTSSVRITDSGSMVVRHTAPRDPRRPHLPGHATSADPSNASAGPSWKVIAAEITADVISAAILFWGAKLLYKWFDPAEAARAAEEKRQQEVRCGAVYGGCVWTCKQRVQW